MFSSFGRIVYKLIVHQDGFGIGT